jgi:protein-L-isoaspartate(D-aspartate) O-methyltransferase
MTDVSLQRLNMVESQVRPSDVTDRRIIRAMGQVPREAFVPEHLKSVAYMDEAVPLMLDAGGRPTRQLIPARVLAKLLQAADLPANGIVLDAGCGSGYSTAVLAKVVRRVAAVEPDAALAEKARLTLAAQGVDNAVVTHGPITGGNATESPFDVILVGGAVPEIPRALLDQLKDGGRLIAIVTSGRAGKATVCIRSGMTFDTRDVFDAFAMPLPGFAKKAEFAL